MVPELVKRRVVPSTPRKGGVQTNGNKKVKVSDLTGVDLRDDEVVTVTVKDAGKKFEASADES